MPNPDHIELQEKLLKEHCTRAIWDAKQQLFVCQTPIPTPTTFFTDIEDLLLDTPGWSDATLLVGHQRRQFQYFTIVLP